jgi:hypothetical protein
MTKTNAKPLYLESIESTIHEDSFENGEGESTGCGLREKIGQRFKDKKEMLQYLEKMHGLSSDENDYEEGDQKETLETDKQCANHSEEQNGGWMTPTSSEIEQWKAGKLKLYNEHYRIVFHYISE